MTPHNDPTTGQRLAPRDDEADEGACPDCLPGSEDHCPDCRDEGVEVCDSCDGTGLRRPDSPMIATPELDDDGTCPDCLPHSQCLACADDDRFHRERDMRCEEGL